MVVGVNYGRNLKSRKLGQARLEYSVAVAVLTTSEKQRIIGSITGLGGGGEWSRLIGFQPLMHFKRGGQEEVDRFTRGGEVGRGG